MVEDSDTGDETGPPPVSRTAYRQALSRFATGVTIATTYVDDLDYAMTVTAFSSVSLDPPLVLVCVEKRARFHDAVLRGGVWAVSVLSNGAAEVSERLATRGRPLGEQLDGIGYERGVTGAAVLLDALARIECRTWATYDGGDHTIVVGEVVVATVREEGTEAADSAGPDGPVESSASSKSAPLLHFRGGYGNFSDF